MNDTSASINLPDVIEKMKELKTEIEKHPNLLVMTTATLVKIRDVIKDDTPHHHLSPLSVIGIPVEDYPTVEACLDRMMEQRKGERPVLVLTEDIPVECANHPWIKQQLEQLYRQFWNDQWNS